MRCVHPVLIGAAVLATAIGSSLTAGCSCEESEAPAPRIVRAARPEPAAPAEPAGGAGAAPAGGRGPVGESILAAPGEYYGTVVRAPRYARTVTNKSKLTHEIEQYRALHGQYPPSLPELCKWSGRTMPEPPRGQRYVYDPKTGKLDLAPTDQ